MGLKKYIGAALIFIVAIAAYVFSIAQVDYQITVFDTSYLLPVAVWVILPLCVLFLASVAHMLFYGIKGYMNKASLNKDETNIIKLIKSKLLKKEETFSFKNPVFQDLGEILSQVSFELKSSSFSSKNSEINDLARAICDIQNKKYVPLSYKLAPNNELAIANNINKINEQADWAIEVLKKATHYTQEEIEAALSKALHDKSMTSLKKILPSLKLNKEMLKELFKKDAVQGEFSLSHEELTKQIKSVEFTRTEFLEIARLYKKSLTPDQIIALFEELSNSNDLALDAYVYILFEYELIDKIRDIFASTSTEELTAFKALLDLKDSGKMYTLDGICYLN